MPHYRHKWQARLFRVAGKGKVPFTLLLGEHCRVAPFSYEDANKLLNQRGERNITLINFSTDGLRVNAARWSRFGWIIVMDEGD